MISAAGSDWSYGGAILTFVFPMLLFIFVAGALYVAYTMPHMVPGHRYEVARQLPTTTAIATPGVAVPGQAAPGGDGGGQAGADEGPAVTPHPRDE